jgi:hypothetical protein
LFANVPKKFFTGVPLYENKGATKRTSAQEAKMAKDIKIAIKRSQDTLIEDLAGAVALVVMLFVGLSLPGVV